MNKKLAIFDGNHLAYRAYYKFSNLKTLDGENTAIIYGMPYVAESLIRRLAPDKVVMVFDGGRSRYRKKLLPTYKERDQKLGFDKESFFKQKDIGRDILISLGVRVAYKRYWEADDIIAMIARRFWGDDWEIVIVSGDKDFNQLIKYNLSVYNVGKGILLHEFNLKEKVGYTPQQCVDYLCLTGDKSDNISGYPGIGEVRATKFLEQFGSINDFLNSNEKFSVIDKDKLKEIYQRNIELIDLKYYYRKHMIHEEIPWINPDSRIDMDQVRKLCNKYEINTFLKPQFINTFKNL